MTASLLPVPKARFFTAAGLPLSGGKVYTYATGTTTPKKSYTTTVVSVGTENTNPVILDANGEADIWLNGNYTIMLQDSTGVQQWSVDNVDSIVDISLVMQPVVTAATLPEAQVAMGLRERLTGNRLYYVRNDGSNTNTGLANTSGGAWLTQAYALAFVEQNLDFNGYTVTVTCTGTFTENLVFGGFVGYNGNGYTQLTFLAAGGAIMNCGTGIGIFSAIHSIPITFEGFVHQGQDATHGICCETDAGGVVAFKSATWGVASTHKLAVHSSSRIIEIAGASTITGNCQTHAYALEGGEVYNQPGLTQTISGGVTISSSYANASANGWIYMANLVWVGTFTGQQYIIGLNGFIQHDTNIGLIPGSISGVDNRPALKTTIQPVRNSRFMVWKNGTSIVSSAGGIVYTAAGWGLYRNTLATGATVSRQTADTAGYRYSLKLQRDSGNASTAALFLIQTFTTEDSIYWAGRTVVLNVRVKKGANFSPNATCGASLVTGTGTNQSIVSGFTGQANAITVNLLTSTTTSNTYSSTPFALGGLTQLAIIINMVPVGVAGVDDSLTFEGIWLSEGNIPTENEPLPYDDEVARANYFQQVYGGSDADEFFMSGAVQSGGATAAYFFPYKAEMFAVPTLTSSGSFESYFPRTNGVANTGTLALNKPSLSRAELTAVVAGTAGDVAYLKAKADATARITLTAELG